MPLTKGRKRLTASEQARQTRERLEGVLLRVADALEAIIGQTTGDNGFMPTQARDLFRPEVSCRVDSVIKEIREQCKPRDEAR